MILKGYIFSITYALICLLLSFAVYKLGLPKKYTRKIVHILVGFEWVILYHYMGAGVHFLAVCLIFLALLTVAYKGKLMPMISSESDNAPGTVYYAVAMVGVSFIGCFLPAVMLPFGIGVMCTSIGDGFAGLVGQIVKKNNPKIYGSKSLVGSLTNLVASSLSAWVISYAYSIDIGLLNCLAIGLLSAGLEIITPFGFDNISITWATTALAYLLMYHAGVVSYILPIIFTPVIIVLVLSKKALTKAGVVAAVLLDIAVSTAFGNRGFIVLCSFFIGAVIVDKVKNMVKKQSRVEYERESDCRNYIQVISNGVVAFLSAIAFLITGNNLLIIPFVASLAEAFSDTVASGIGSFATSVFDPFRWRRCTPGLSGGMSFEGTFASLVAAALISFIAYSLGFSGYGVSEFFIVFISAFLGCIIDSLLGSLLQVKYKCASCGCITEREEHCGINTLKHSGCPYVDNDVVNMISCAFSAILATVLVILI